MKHKRFNEDQVIIFLREVEVGMTGKGARRRRHCISESTFYCWKSKYGGMDVSKAKHLREMEAENRKLKQLPAEAHLDNAALKELLSNTYGPPRVCYSLILNVA